MIDLFLSPEHFVEKFMVNPKWLFILCHKQKAYMLPPQSTHYIT